MGVERPKQGGIWEWGKSQGLNSKEEGLNSLLSYNPALKQLKEL